MASYRRVSDALFRRDMVGPSFGHIAASVTGLLLVEKLAMDHLVPLLAPTFEAFVATYGKMATLVVQSFVLLSISFWGIGSLFSLPALLGCKRWKIQPAKETDVQMLLRSLPIIVFNFFLSIIVVPPLFYALLPDSAYDFQNPPGVSTLLRDILVWISVEEVMFYYSHRWLHENKAMYQAVHKLHHTWTAPIALVAIYCHPLEHIISNIAPLVVGPLLCGSHLASIGVFLFLGLVHTEAVHSGYWICDDNGMHDEHHAKFTVNYGVLGLMDAWHGTYRLPAGAAGLESRPAVPSKQD